MHGPKLVSLFRAAPVPGSTLRHGTDSITLAKWPQGLCAFLNCPGTMSCTIGQIPADHIGREAFAEPAQGKARCSSGLLGTGEVTSPEGQIQAGGLRRPLLIWSPPCPPEWVCGRSQWARRAAAAHGSPRSSCPRCFRHSRAAATGGGSHHNHVARHAPRAAGCKACTTTVHFFQLRCVPMRCQISIHLESAAC